MAKIQVWNHGEIDLIEDRTTEQKARGKVGEDGKVTASESAVVVRRPVKIPHRTPGVLIEAGVGMPANGCFVDFGSIVVHFGNIRRFDEPPALDVVFDSRVGASEGELGSAEGADISTANTINDQVLVYAVDQNGGVDEWWCRPRFAYRGDNRPFLIYRGGLKESTRRLQELDEKRATGRRVGERP